VFTALLFSIFAPKATKDAMPILYKKKEEQHAVRLKFIRGKKLKQTHFFFPKNKINIF